MAAPRGHRCCHPRDQHNNPGSVWAWGAGLDPSLWRFQGFQERREGRVSCLPPMVVMAPLEPCVLPLPVAPVLLSRVLSRAGDANTAPNPGVPEPSMGPAGGEPGHHSQAGDMGAPRPSTRSGEGPQMPKLCIALCINEVWMAFPKSLSCVTAGQR